MQYGHFDNTNREYVIDRVDLPVSWTNYLGVEKTCMVVNHTAGGYLFHDSPEYHRVTRFRPNAVPMDRPGHYVYIRDNEDGEYFTISWQPVGKDLDQANYRCRHGLSYSVFECAYKDLKCAQRMSVPMGDDVLLWDVTVENTSGRTRDLSLFSYLEFSFHQVQIDNQNFQMSLYCAGSSYRDGVILYDLFYEEFGNQFFTADFEPDGFDCLRDAFLGTWHTESDPAAVERGRCSGSFEKGGNHCGALQKDLILEPGEKRRFIFMLGEGGLEEARKARAAYSDHGAVDRSYELTRRYWDRKCAALQVDTPSSAMNTMLNIWTLYQSEINVLFSRFASFIEVGGRTGLGYRDTAQDSMTIPHAEPEGCRKRIGQLLQGLTSQGYGLHLFEPRWFEPKDPDAKEPFRSPTVIPRVNREDIVHGLEDACADDALWLVPAIVEYIRETGDLAFADAVYTYADGGEGTVYEHMKKILDFSAREVGQTGICKGLRADWNDCLNLGGGESSMVSFLHVWALEHFIELAGYLAERRPAGSTESHTDSRAEKGAGIRQHMLAEHMLPEYMPAEPVPQQGVSQSSHINDYAADAAYYTALRERTIQTCEEQLWDGEWYIRGITRKGKKIGTAADREGRVHLESNAWAVLSGAASHDRGIRAMDSVYEYLFTPYGLMLNAPSYTVPDDDIGFVTRVYPGVKENGSIFSHPNPWAWAAECRLGRGDRAMELYDALCPYLQNDRIEIRQSEPYSYCQFIMGKDHTAFGRARHPFMTGSGGWSYYSATRYMLGIRPEFDALTVDPCIPKAWDGFRAQRIFRGALYRIEVQNPEHVSRGVRRILVDGEETDRIPVMAPGSETTVTVIMGS